MVLRNWAWAVFMALSVLISGCQDDEEILAPGRIETGFEVNKIELNVGESKTLTPKVVADGDLTYRWILNDQEVSDKLEYTFTATESGFYKLTFEVENQSGKSTTTYDIAVVSKIQIGINMKVQVGKSLLLHPSISPDEKVTYKWIYDDEEVSDSAEYTFEASSLGSFTLYLEVTSKTDKQLIAYNIEVVGPYTNGVFIINEGWFGHEKGSINFWDRESDEILFKVFENENEGKQLGNTTQYACINDGKLFLVSKDPDHLVVVNAETLVEEGRVSITESGMQARGFAYMDARTGFLSSTDGIFKVDLAQYQLGDKIPEITGQVGNMIVVGDRLFALKSKNLLVINTSSLDIEKTIPWEGSAEGMVKDKDGNLWIGASSQLIKVNPSTLDFELIDLPEGYAVNTGFTWNAGSLTYSKEDNALFFTKKGGWTPGTVVKFDIETKTASDFCTIDSDFQIYGAGTYVDPITNRLYVTCVKNGWGQNYKYNKLYVYTMDGTMEKCLEYEHFYFPALCVVNN